MAPCATSYDKTITTFVYDNRVYASPTCATFPGGLPDDNPETSPHRASWHRCCWAKKDFPELAFYPTARRLKGALFEVLPPFKIIKKVQLDHKEAANGRELHRMMDAEKISALELTLVKARRILIYRTGSLVSVDYQAIRPASSERYTEWQDNRERAQKAAFFARRRILYEVGHISWAIAHLTAMHGDTQAWARMLVKEGFHPSDVEAMQGSSLADFGEDNPRAGVFVRPDCEWFLKLPVLVAAQVPVYVDWGPITAPFKLPSAANIGGLHWLRPSEQQICDVIRVSAVDSSVLQRPPSPIADPSWAATSNLPSTSSALAVTSNSPPTSSAWGSGPVERWGVSTSDPTASTTHSTASKAIPVPPRWSEDMSVGEFFRKRAAWFVRWTEYHEDADQKQSRRQREENARKFRVPNGRNVALYVWVQSPSKAWKREIIKKQDHMTYWTMFSNRCKRYDGAANEWDIAPFFDRASKSSDGTAAALDRIYNGDSSDDEDCDDETEAADPCFRDKDFCTPPGSPRGLVIVREASDDDLVDMDKEDDMVRALRAEPPYLELEAERWPGRNHRTRAEDAALHVDDRHVAADPLAKDLRIIRGPPTLASVIQPSRDNPLIKYNLSFVFVLQNLYGWRRGTELLPPPEDTKQKIQDLTAAFKVFGYVAGGSGARLSHPEQADEFIRWASMMSSKAPEPQAQGPQLGGGPPASWWHFHESTDARREILRTLSRTPLQVRPFVGTVVKMGVRTDCTHAVYAITPREWGNDDPWWWIVAVDPRAAMYIALTARTLREAAWDMARSGMAFHTVARTDAEAQVVGYRIRPVRTILWRPADYTFTPDDFACYVAARRYFLQERGIARAAFLMGGIVWRLAYEAEHPHVVLEGPDIERLALTQEYRLEANGKAYVDDLLNEDELALITGEYRQEVMNPDHMASPSWWPSASTWRRSALDVGFWSPVAERWYQDILSRYRDGTLKPRRPRAWSRYLVNWDRRAHNASIRVIRAAEEILVLSGTH